MDASTKLKSAFSTFWLHNPLLLYAFSAFIGIQSAFLLAESHFFLNFLLFFLSVFFLFPLFSPRYLLKGCLASLITFSFLITVFFCCSSPSLELEEKDSGTLLFWMSSLKKIGEKDSPYLLYGTVFCFEGEKSQGTFFKGSIKLTSSSELPPSSLFQMKGSLRKKEDLKGNVRFVFSKEPASLTVPLFSFPPLALYRFYWKESFYQFLSSHYGNRSLPFLFSLFTGENTSKEQAFTFHRFGLDHVLAVSGFHFALLMALFNQIFSLFFKGKIKNIFLFSLLFGYFIFLGPLPSVMRSFFTLFFFFFAFFFEKSTLALNALGGSIFFLLFLDPYLLQSTGFILSVLATLSLLLLHPLLEPFFQKISPKRSIKDLQQRSIFSLFLLKILDIFIKNLSVLCAVLLMLFPFLLKLNGSIPLLGIFFQIFFPLFTLPSLTILLLAITLTPFLPTFSTYLHSLCYFYTESLLQGLYEVPLHYDLNFYLSLPSFFPFEAFFVFSLFISILLKKAASSLHPFLKG